MIEAWRSLNIITRIILAATALHILGDLIIAYQDIKAFAADGATITGRPTNLGLVIAGIVHPIAYSVLFLASAATVELLFRIWCELKLLRAPEPAPRPRQDT